MQKYSFWIFIVLLGLVYFLPLPSYYVHILILTLFYAYLGTAWNLMCGFGGQLSLGFSAFTGIGAYVTLLLYLFFNISPWLGMLAGAALSCAIMMITAYPCFKFGLSGPFFTLASIAVAEIIRDVLTALRGITGGSLGLSLPYQHSKPGPLSSSTAKKNTFLVILIMFALAVFIVQKTHGAPAVLSYGDKRRFGRCRCSVRHLGQPDVAGRGGHKFGNGIGGGNISTCNTFAI